MGSPTLPSAAIFLLLLLLLSPFTLASPPSSTSIPDDSTLCLEAQLPGLTNNVQGAIQEFGRALSLVSTFVGLFGDRRLTSAIQDCVDLVDYSVDELNLVLTESNKANGSSTPVNKGPPSAHNLKTWLSAALGNQDTCLDGFDGTDGSVKLLLQGTLQQVTGLVGNILDSVAQIPGVPPRSGGNRRLLALEQRPSSRSRRAGILKTGRPSLDPHQLLGHEVVDGFPSWLSAAERRLLQAPAPGVAANAVVAKDGSGNFLSVQEAVLAAPTKSASRYVIYVKQGTYYENVEIKKKKTNLMLVGDGMGVTIISGNRSFIDGWTTFRSATFAVAGAGFIARDITFENSAGPEKHQAVAARVDSDLSAFFRVSFVGYQDTLYAHSLRQFYRECQVYGTVDFIFGNGQVVFQNCLIVARKPLPDQKNSITAQGRKDPNQNTGFSLQFCNITGDSQLVQSSTSTYSYLGRPWKPYSRTVIMQSYISGIVRPEGWLEWNGDLFLDTLYYAEYLNYGPGAALGGRVKWPGYHIISNPSEALNFTVGQFLDGNNWLPTTGIRYTAGLST
ncbi:pectinesterase/pectinesterase inhibitor PPE8B-like [Nymphaea colorata]|nr:pectinesterase/pectinesterase inhibitor PPE8B-like [Nymphaea colorata]